MRACLAGFLVLLCVAIGAGPSAADSSIDYPWGEWSIALDLGTGIAFVFHDTYYRDLWIQSVDFYANLHRVALQTDTAGLVAGYAFYLEFEGFAGPYSQYGVYTCDGFSWDCSFGGRRGTMYLL